MSITRRKALRRDIRNTLGSTRMEAPSTEQVLRVTHYLDELLQITSGRYTSVRVFDNREGEYVLASKALGNEVRARREKQGLDPETGLRKPVAR